MEPTKAQCEQWARSVRAQYRRELLSPEIIAACEDLSGWTWELKRSKTLLPFGEARAYVRTLGLKNTLDWAAYCKSDKPANIPAYPCGVYKDWISWNDWLGKNYPPNYLPFEKARAFVHTLKLKSDAEWRVYCKSGEKPQNITGHPHRVYANKGWVSWGDWLGTGNKPGRPAKAKAAGA